MTRCHRADQTMRNEGHPTGPVEAQTGLITFFIRMLRKVSFRLQFRWFTSY